MDEDFEAASAKSLVSRATFDVQEPPKVIKGRDVKTLALLALVGLLVVNVAILDFTHISNSQQELLKLRLEDEIEAKFEAIQQKLREELKGIEPEKATKAIAKAFKDPEGPKKLEERLNKSLDSFKEEFLQFQQNLTKEKPQVRLEPQDALKALRTDFERQMAHVNLTQSLMLQRESFYYLYLHILRNFIRSAENLPRLEATWTEDQRLVFHRPRRSRFRHRSLSSRLRGFYRQNDRSSRPRKLLRRRPLRI